MGNKHSSDVAEDVKRQAECQIPMYNFVNLSGGGELIELMKKAKANKDYTEVSLRIIHLQCVKESSGLWLLQPI